MANNTMTNLSRRSFFRGLASAAFAAVVAKVGAFVPQAIVTSRLGGYLVPADWLADVRLKFAEAAAIEEDKAWMDLDRELDIAFITGSDVGPPVGILAKEPPQLTGVVRDTWVMDGPDLIGPICGDWDTTIDCD